MDFPGCDSYKLASPPEYDIPDTCPKCGEQISDRNECEKCGWTHGESEDIGADEAYERWADK